MNDIIQYRNTDDLIKDACSIIDDAQLTAYHSVNAVLTLRNWLLGKRIAEEELKGEHRADYGAETIKKLADSLTEKYGKGFTKRTVYKFQQFYKYFPEIVRSMTAQSEVGLIVPTVTARLLSWSHYERLLRSMIRRQETGMRKKRMNRLGA